MATGGAHMMVFDLDDTLYLEREFVRSGFDAVAQRLVALGHPEAPYARTFLDLLDAQGSGQVFDDALTHHGIHPDGALIGDLVRTYRFHPPTISAQPGIADLLARLAGAGLGLGVITDGAVTIQRGKLAALGLLDRFEHVLCTDELGPDRLGWKPSPLPFETMERRFRCAGPHMTYVGDNPGKDFQGALARGWRAVRLRVPGQLHSSLRTPAGVAEVTSVEALAALLDATVETRQEALSQ